MMFFFLKKEHFRPTHLDEMLKILLFFKKNKTDEVLQKCNFFCRKNIFLLNRLSFFQKKILQKKTMSCQMSVFFLFGSISTPAGVLTLAWPDALAAKQKQLLSMSTNRNRSQSSPDSSPVTPPSQAGGPRPPACCASQLP